ncbi:MAG: hypothetical protein A2X61_00015 [Ignavibacteria bacterium GWB2_35_12]|nr:MAG: hypothetical protein A2X61_00015 [Ignavibacteria bacterium GWB2_35_12]OGU96274.1 MAG: hypothetical protein A2220_07325 [Ignavibacteria bacterium RIFOXYA2_FULL_35_10]OGV20695.1 MAG: hypothetical protein A2475_05840 [Ignavibacteria bacterium RIFOXYC2_FULL_35_21]
MRFIIKTIVVGLLFYSSLFGKNNIAIKFYFNNDTCQKVKEVVFLIGSNSNYYDKTLLILCEKVIIFNNLSDNSLNMIEEYETAHLTNGNIESNNFEILIYDPNRSRYTHKLFYNNIISKAVLEDYTDNGSEPSTYEEADSYFYTQQMGSTLLITKKAEIDVQSVFLCSLEGRIISSLQNVEGWSQYSFNMSFEPSGMYLLRFIARDKALTKRVIYIR